MPTKTKTNRITPPRTLHPERFPGAGKQYRAARDKLLRAEIDLRRRTEAVAALRRQLPLGGAVPQHYEFEEAAGQVKLFELFAPGKDTLVIYNFMYGPNMEHACATLMPSGRFGTSLISPLTGAGRNGIRS